MSQVERWAAFRRDPGRVRNVRKRKNKSPLRPCIERARSGSSFRTFKENPTTSGVGKS